MNTKWFNQFESIMNVSVTSFWSIWIPILWVYDHYKYFTSWSAWIVFRRHNLTSTDVSFSLCISICWLWETIDFLWDLHSKRRIYSNDLFRHKIWIWCCFNIGPLSATLAQHYINTGLTSRVGGPLLYFDDLHHFSLQLPHPQHYVVWRSQWAVS